MEEQFNQDLSGDINVFFKNHIKRRMVMMETQKNHGGLGCKIIQCVSSRILEKEKISFPDHAHIQSHC